MRRIRKPYTVISICLLLFFAATSCKKTLQTSPPGTSAVETFEELWTFMDRHYALFDVKQIEWKMIYDKYRSTVTNAMTEAALFEVCADMLEELKDGHVTLISPFKTFTYENFYRLFPTNFNYPNISANYLGSSSKVSGPFIYTIKQGIGYLYCKSFRDDYTNEDLEKVFNELQSTTGLILDIRSNTGGKAGNVNRLVQKFLDKKTLVKYELVKSGPGHNQFLLPNAYYLEPTAIPYSNPVIVLTNRTCFSACNDFASYMNYLPQVTILGDQTGGGGSIPNNYILANGWTLQYSSTITLSADKIPIDAGITPDIYLNISPIDETNGIDPLIEKAFLLLK
ncbi:MAG: S41 family peptidase [Chitinophagaceae bacterium]|nr:S41 family peptidase [Chitinophagaceae bacterium]